MGKEPKTDLKGTVQIQVSLRKRSAVKGNIIRSMTIYNNTVSEITSELKHFYRDYITYKGPQE